MYDIIFASEYALASSSLMFLFRWKRFMHHLKKIGGEKNIIMVPLNDTKWKGIATYQPDTYLTKHKSQWISAKGLGQWPTVSWP